MDLIKFCEFKEHPEEGNLEPRHIEIYVRCND